MHVGVLVVATFQVRKLSSQRRVNVFERRFRSPSLIPRTTQRLEELILFLLEQTRPRGLNNRRKSSFLFSPVQTENFEAAVEAAAPRQARVWLSVWPWERGKK